MRWNVNKAKILLIPKLQLITIDKKKIKIADIN